MAALGHQASSGSHRPRNRSTFSVAWRIHAAQGMKACPQLEHHPLPGGSSFPAGTHLRSVARSPSRSRSTTSSPGTPSSSRFAASTPLDIVVFALGLLLLPPAVLHASSSVLAALAGERALARRAPALCRRAFGARPAPGWRNASRRTPAPRSSSWPAVVRSGRGVPLRSLRGGPLVPDRARPGAVHLRGALPLPLAGRQSSSSRRREADPGRRTSIAEIPVVFIMFDELSTVALLGADGRVNASASPTLPTLRSDATFYREATTVHAFTEHAVPLGAHREAARPGRAADLRRPSGRTSSRCSGTATACASASRSRISAPSPSASRRMSSRVGERSDVARVGLLALYLHVAPAGLAGAGPPAGRPDVGGLRGHERRRRERRGPRSPTASLRAGLRLRATPSSGSPPRSSALPPRPAPAHPLALPALGASATSGTRARSRASTTASGTTTRFLTEQGYERYLLQVGYTDRALGHRPRPPAQDRPLRPRARGRRRPTTA